MPEPSPEGTRLVVEELQELADTPPSPSPRVFTSLVARGRARRFRRRLVTAVGVAAVAASVAAVTWQVNAFPLVNGSAPAVRPTGVSTLDSWTQEPSPPWTPTTPSPSVSEFQPTPEPSWTPSPSPPPAETPQPGDVPAVVVPRSASLGSADVPRPLVLFEDSGPILKLARVIPTMELCESATTGEEKLGAAPIGGRTWRWQVARESTTERSSTPSPRSPPAPAMLASRTSDGSPRPVTPATPTPRSSP